MIQKDRGFILKKFDFGETSLIATIYSYRFGKIKGIFKGFYTNKKEFSSPLDTFSLNEFIFYPKESEIWLVSYAELISNFSFLRRDLKKAAVSGFIFNLVDKTMQVWDRNEYIFGLLFYCLDLLEKDPAKAFYVFSVKFLTLAGIKPELNHCIACGNLIKGSLFFSTSRGGLLCSGCCKNYRSYKMVTREASKTFSYIQSSPIGAAGRICLSPSCQEEIFHIIKKFLEFHFDFRLPLELSQFAPDSKKIPVPPAG